MILERPEIVFQEFLEHGDVPQSLSNWQLPLLEGGNHQVLDNSSALAALQKYHTD